MSFSRWKSLHSTILRDVRRWRERANHRPTVEHVSAMSPLSRAFDETGLVERYCGKLQWT